MLYILFTISCSLSFFIQFCILQFVVLRFYFASCSCTLLCNFMALRNAGLHSIYFSANLYRGLLLNVLQFICILYCNLLYSVFLSPNSCWVWQYKHKFYCKFPIKINLCRKGEIFSKSRKQTLDKTLISCYNNNKEAACCVGAQQTCGVKLPPHNRITGARRI